MSSLRHIHCGAACALLRSRRLPLSRLSAEAMAGSARRADFQSLIMALQQFWAARGCIILQPYDMIGRRRYVSSGNAVAKPWPRALARRLCAAVAPAGRRAAWPESQSPAALLSVPGHSQAVARGYAGPVSRQPGRARHRSGAARHPVCRRRLGKPHAGRLGAGLGSLVRRYGDLAIHLFSAGRRNRLRADFRRTHIRPGTLGDVCAGR